MQFEAMAGLTCRDSKGAQEGGKYVCITLDPRVICQQQKRALLCVHACYPRVGAHAFSVDSCNFLREEKIERSRNKKQGARGGAVHVG